MNLHYLRLIQLESELDIRPRILEIGRRSAKLDIEVYLENVIVAKAIVVCQVMRERRRLQRMDVVKEIMAAIKQYETIIIHRHQRPDPDAIGSQVGLAELLRASFPEKIFIK